MAICCLSLGIDGGAKWKLTDVVVVFVCEHHGVNTVVLLIGKLIVQLRLLASS